MVTGDEAVEMQKAIMRGKSFEDSGMPDTQEYRDEWDRIVRDIQRIRARGYSVDIPHDWPEAG